MFGPLGIFGMVTGNPILALVEQALVANSEACGSLVPGSSYQRREQREHSNKRESIPDPGDEFGFKKSELLEIIKVANARGFENKKITDFVVEPLKEGGYQIRFISE